ncbi:hypothetical protein KGF57_001262 [Candida theae]|uniref:FYVE-type domain-containing protein n=1 Tax=Candida theae TaxID=1198502 RepID=A0AAD5BHD7_9ASCO|nr:uncharacterized protein KGF57_001262 [Candida theae]KAI5963384.1 hypothetical protein KGF57_001262 [Candida theae]
MLRATTETTTTSSSYHPDTDRANARRKSSIVITPSQILCGSFDSNTYSAMSNDTGTTTPTVLPPFSFSKKPIDTKVNTCEELKSNISKAIRRESRSTTPRSPQLPISKDIIDYDEKIRFPQMTSCQYIYDTQPKTNRTTSFETDSHSNLDSDFVEKKEYKPAAVDMNSTRRYSTPNKTDPYNSLPKLCDKVSNQTLNQVYPIKKPLMTPAVLRAEPLVQQSHQTKKYSPNTNELTSTWKDDKSTPLAQNMSTSFTVFMSDFQCINISTEPSHQHWQPNSATNACMACLRSFHSPLVTMLYDVPKRHHCRFCGLIFCKSCLDSTSGTSKSSISSASSTLTSSTTESVGVCTEGDLQHSEYTIIIDNKSNFIIPVNSKDANAITSLACQTKICNKCSRLYKTLSTEINKRENLLKLVKCDSVLSQNDSSVLGRAEAVVVVENPYNIQSNISDYETTTPLKLKQLTICIKKSGIKGGNGAEIGSDVGAQEERRMSVVGEVPNDWTWSSF